MNMSGIIVEQSDIWTRRCTGWLTYERNFSLRLNKIVSNELNYRLQSEFEKLHFACSKFQIKIKKIGILLGNDRETVIKIMWTKISSCVQVC